MVTDNKIMKIETYKLEDNSTEASAMAADSQAIELCQELGLNGQLTISNQETMTRAPFGVMTSEEYNVYSLGCPEKVDIKAYNNEPIPLRVLEIYKFAISQECALRFDSIQVWSTKSAVITDPLLVGVIKIGYATTWYLLARWGKELVPFLEFKEQVIAARKVELTSKLKKYERQIKDLLCDMDDYVNTFSTPSFYP